ncbi:MAG: site-specific integrase [Thermoflexales bacterium]|nr:site-specific integrase [Thermoflexales bacterium]
MQRAAGLRVAEAVHLQARCIEPDGTKVILTGTGIHTKGRKEREIPVMPKYQEFVRQLREQGMTHEDGHVFVHRQTLTRAYGREVSALCARLKITSGSGSHSFRKTWSGEYYRYLCGQGLSSKEARRQVTAALGHNRLNVLRHYLTAA